MIHACQHCQRTFERVGFRVYKYCSNNCRIAAQKTEATNKRNSMRQLCACGCGEYTSGKRNENKKNYPKFILGHHMKAASLNNQVLHPSIEMVICCRCGVQKAWSREFFTYNSTYGLRQPCKECHCKESKTYYHTHRNMRLLKASEYRKKYPERLKRYYAEYSRNNKEKIKLKGIKRRNNKLSLPFDFTNADWEYCLSYWGHRCAICRKPIGFWHTLAKDHWQAISKGGATVFDNILPLCHGFDGCNNKKQDKNPLMWLQECFGTKKAKKINKEIQKYFEAIREWRLNG